MCDEIHTYEVAANELFLLDIFTAILNFFPCVVTQFFSFALVLKFSVAIDERFKRENSVFNVFSWIRL